MFTTIMFDCDGVLIDSETLVNRLHVEELVRLGFDVDYDDMLQRFCGVRDDEMFAELEREFGKALPADYAALIGRRIEEEYPVSLTAISGVEAALAQIDRRMCVVSSSPPAKLKFGLDLVNLSRFFMPDLFSGWSVERSKPAPDVFLYAAKEMGVDPAECIVVEDSVAGVTAGAAAGMTVLGFEGGEHCPPGHEAVLRAAGAHLVYADMRELPGIIERLSNVER